MRKVLIFCLLGLFFSLKTSAQEEQEYLDPYQLIRVAVQKARENDKIKSELLIFNRTKTVQKLDPSGRPRSNNPNSGKPLPQGKGRNNEPLELDMNLILETSYYLGFDPEKIQTLNGEPVYIVHFWPRDKFGEGETGYYTAAKRAYGIIYINKEHLYLQRLEAEMGEPFNIYLGLGRLRAAKFTFEQKLIPNLNNIVVIDTFSAIVKYRYLVREHYEKYTYNYTNYQLAQ